MRSVLAIQEIKDNKEIPVYRSPIFYILPEVV
jgi:hypothetical protein